MPDWPWIGGSLQYETGGADATNTRGTTLTRPASNNAKGAWVELIASTALPADLLVLMLRMTVLGDCLVDIGIGAAGSEKVLIPDVLHSGRASFASHVRFPVRIPVGTRIAARYQVSVYSGHVLYGAVLLGSNPFLPGPGLQRVTAYGVNAGDSGAVGVDPGSVANTKGAYSEVEDSTANPIRLLYIALGIQYNNVMTGGDVLLDVAIGAAGSEKDILSNVWVYAADTENYAPAVLGPFPVNIPAGTRLAVRAQSTITDATDRLFDVALYGVD